MNRVSHRAACAVAVRADGVYLYKGPGEMCERVYECERARPMDALFQPERVHTLQTVAHTTTVQTRKLANIQIGCDGGYFTLYILLISHMMRECDRLFTPGWL